VDGEELSSQWQALGITVEKEVNRIPWAKISLLDGDPSKQDFQLSNHDLFIPGKEIEIQAGYHSSNETIFKGVVVRHSIKIRPDKAMLVVECKDMAVKLTAGRKSKYFYDSKDSDILDEIIAYYSLEKEIEETDYSHPEMVQYNVNDWDFLISRAQANGKVVVVDDGKISILSPAYDESEVLTLVYGATILDFDAEIDAENQFSNITAYGWNAAEQTVQDAVASDIDTGLNGNLSSSELAGVINLDELSLKDGGEMTVDSLQQWADAKKLFNELSKIRGSVKFQGVASVKPNTTLLLEGVGDRFNGKTWVSAMRHQIAEGNWTCTAQFGMNPKWFTEKTSINDLPASGLLAAVSGLQVAVVSQLEEDPEGENRILVRMPIIDGNEQGVWARIATLDAGENRGSFFLPEIGDEVIIGFINDNPNDPVVLGMLNSSAKPAPIAATDDNHEKGFVTRSEMKFVFDDDKPAVTLETPAGKKISIDEDAGIIQLEDENSNLLILDSNGIKMESQGNVEITTTGDVKIEGTNIEIAASATLKAEGSASAEVAAGGNMVVKGGIVQIN
jgi:Rhs element Vgr protein